MLKFCFKLNHELGQIEFIADKDVEQCMGKMLNTVKLLIMKYYTHNLAMVSLKTRELIRAILLFLRAAYPMEILNPATGFEPDFSCLL